MAKINQYGSFRIREDCAYLLEVDKSLCVAMDAMTDGNKMGIYGVLRAHIWTRNATKMQEPNDDSRKALEVASHVERELRELIEKVEREESVALS